MNDAASRVECWGSIRAVYFLLLLQLVSCAPESGGGVTGHVACTPTETKSHVTVATYNIHSGIGRDGKRNLGRIAETLHGADFVGLQEVDNGRVRSGFENQARSVAAALRHQYWQHFPAEDYWPLGTYGTAASSSFPIVASGIFDLPIVEKKPLRRLAWIESFVDCRPIHVFIIHATRVDDSMASAQAAQIEAAWRIISEKAVRTGETALFMGDFNATPDSYIIRWLRERMTDVIEDQVLQSAGTVRLDHIFVRGDLSVLKAEIRDKGASDHPAVVATLAWK